MHNNNFNVFRLLAATLVLVSHAFPLAGKTFEPMSLFSKYGTLGGLGVAIFFTLSGYLIQTSYSKDSNAYHFFLKRLLRIVPAYYFMIIALVVVVGPMVSTYSLENYFYHRQTLSYFYNLYFFPLRYELPGVFINNPIHAVNGSIWSLPIEILMYLLIFCLCKLNIKGYRWSFFLYLAFVVSTELIHNNFISIDLSWFYLDAKYILEFGSYFFFGSFAAHFSKNKINSGIYPLLTLPVLFFLLKTDFARLSMLLLLPITVLSLALREELNISKFYTKTFGDISYGFYLYAFPVQQLTILFIPDLNFTALIFIQILITFVVAYGSWIFIEQPFLKFKPIKT